MDEPVSLRELQTMNYWLASRAVLRGDMGVTRTIAARHLAELWRRSHFPPVRNAAYGSLACLGICGMEQMIRAETAPGPEPA